MAEPDRLEQQGVEISPQPEGQETSKPQKTSNGEAKASEPNKQEQKISEIVQEGNSEISPRQLSIFEQIAFELLKDDRYPIEAAPGFDAKELTPQYHEATRKDLTHILFRDRKTGRGVAMMTTKSEGYDPNRNDYEIKVEDGFNIYKDPITNEEVLRLPVVVGGAEPLPDEEQPPQGRQPPEDILSPEALELAHKFYKDVLNVRVVEMTPEAQAAFANAMRWASNPREMVRDINVMAQGFSNFDSLVGKAREEAVGRMQRGVQEGFYGFNLAYTLSDWLKEDPTGEVVRQNVDALIASAEAYPDKEINQQLLGELLQAFTTVLRKNEALRETLRAKVESRYKIHNLNLLAKYIDGEKRGPALTAIYPNEAHSLISIDGVYFALKALEKDSGFFYRSGDGKKDLFIEHQLALIKGARQDYHNESKNFDYNRGGFGIKFDEESVKRQSFNEADVRKALGKMWDARDKDIVGIGPSTLALEQFPASANQQEEDRRKVLRENFEKLLSDTRVAFDIADKTAVGTGFAADSAKILLKDESGKVWSGQNDRHVWKNLLNNVPLHLQKWHDNDKFKDIDGEEVIVNTDGHEVINLRQLLSLKAKWENGEVLTPEERAQLKREGPLLSLAIKKNSNLIPMAFSEAKQKVMEAHWNDIDFANASTGDGGREIGVETWHNVRQESQGSRNVSLKGVRRFNDSASVNLVDAAGEGSMTDLLIKWDDLYNSAVRPMEKRARVNRRLHDQLVEDEPYLFREIKSLFGDPVAALNAIRKKAIGADLHEEEADRLMGTYADGVVYANKEMFDQTGGLYQRKNALDFAYIFANMVKEGVITPKKASELYNKHLGRFRGIFVTLLQSFSFMEALWAAFKQFVGATVSTK